MYRAELTIKVELTEVELELTGVELTKVELTGVEFTWGQSIRSWLVTFSL